MGFQMFLVFNYELLWVFLQNYSTAIGYMTGLAGILRDIVLEINEATFSQILSI